MYQSLRVTQRIFWSLLVSLCWIGLSCCGEPETELTPSLVLNDREGPLQWEPWTWEELLVSTTSPTRQGRFMLSVESSLTHSYAPVDILTQGSDLSDVIQISMPLNEQFSGTVSVAIDATSTPAPIPVYGRLSPKNDEGFVSFLEDQDPFSTAQLLFTTSRFTSDLQGALNPRAFKLIAEPQGLPPFTFQSIPLPRFNLTLPPLTELLSFSLRIWLNPDIGLNIGRATVSIWWRDERLSDLVQSSADGRATLSMWRARLETLDPNEQIKIRITPQVAGELPSLEHTLPVSDLLSSTPESELELYYPKLSSMITLPIRIDVDDDTASAEPWVIHTIQVWGEELEESFRELQPSAILSRQRGKGVWRKAIAFMLNQRIDLRLYSHEAVLFIQPSITSERRTQRIELNSINPTDTIQITPLRQPLIRGQLRDEAGGEVVAHLRFEQLAWPWPDAAQLPLRTYFTDTDSQGGFAQNIEPGIYALHILPARKTLAPKILIFRVPESEGVLLGPQQGLVYRGQKLELRVGAQDLIDTNEESRIELFCLLSKSDPIFQGTSLRSLSFESLQISLLRGSLPRGFMGNITLHEASCPAWSLGADDSTP